MLAMKRAQLPVRKRFGQHFLEPVWADKLVAAIEPHAGDRFLEIGPGPGALTLRLAPRVAHLTAVEVDRDLAAALEPRLPPNVELVVADFLDLDLTSVLQRGPVRVAGNLPYNISSPILFKLIEAARPSVGAGLQTRPRANDPPTLRQAQGRPEHRRGASPRPFDQLEVAPSIAEWRTRDPSTSSGSPRAPSRAEPAIVDATLMLQREVAERLEARPGSGDYGVLSILVQLQAEVRRVLSLPPGAFRPAPKVHSAVVRLTFRQPALPPRDEQVFEAMVRSAFTQRRKTLANALSPFAGSRNLRAVAALEAAGIDPSRRPETLDLAELTRLADQFAGRSVR
jgi:16S rRNA A1518/A1519 N6-dimethyltransferase RsmA/KsgA/DIM1 with predicted DNA glycosylase/AP lyase activity